MLGFVPELKRKGFAGAHPLKTILLLSGLISLLLTPAASAQDNPTSPPGQTNITKGVFLIATDNLAHSSFNQTVIVITHFSKFGTTGLTINRRSKIPLKDVFPEVKTLNNPEQEVLLGGPVHPEALTMLIRSDKPQSDLREIHPNIYFVAGMDAVSRNLKQNQDSVSSRAYAGYAGWAPGQLQAEIKRGDWLVVNTDPSIIFEEDVDQLWHKLKRSWSGSWI